MTFQYGDLRVDQLTYTSGGANQTVTVSGLVQQVTTGGTTSGNVRIEGDLTVTGTIEGNTITGNIINANTANLTNISGENLNYTNGTISGLTVEGNATVTGNLNTVGTVTGDTVSASFGSFTTLTGLTTTGTTANFTSGNFTNLSGGTITGDTLNVTSGNFVNISGGSITVSGITVTGDIDLPSTITGVSGLFTFVSGNTITGDTVQGTTGIFEELDIATIVIENATFEGDVVVSGDLTVEGTITGVTTITGTTANFTTGNFQVIEGPISTTTVTGVTRIATAAEAASAVGPSGTYTDTISGDANSAFAINPSGLSSAIRAYDPPVGDSAGTKIYARVVTTTGIAPDFAISGVTWSGIEGVDVTAVTDEQATSAVRPSGTYGAVASGSATSEFFYNPVQLEKTFKSYDPVATAAEEQLYARIVSGVSDGQGGFNVGSYGWIQVPTGTPSIATEAQAQAAAGASGTYSEVPTAANIPNIINPNRLRAALQAYDPGIISGERRIYARVVSGVTDTEGDYEWLNVTDAVAGDFLPLSGGTVAGYTNFEAGLGVSGNVQITGNITQTGNHTTSGTYNASRSSNANQVLYQVNNSAGRGMYQGDHQGVAFAKGGSGIAEFTVTGDQIFGVVSGDLRVGGDAQNVSDVNSSQFWALSGGQFVSAFSTNESIVWKDATQGDILKLQSNVGGQRADQFIFSVSGDLTVTGKVTAQTGEFLEIDAFEENNGLIRSFSGDFHDLVVGDPAVYGAFLENPALQVIGSGIFHSGVFFTANNVPQPLALYATATGTNSPNTVIGSPDLLGGAATRNSIAIGRDSQGNASSDSDSNISIGNLSLFDMTDGEKNVAIGHSSMQNVRPGVNQGLNTALGYQAMLGNGNASNSCRENVAVGANALDAVLNARENVAVGRDAMTAATTVTGNTAVGFDAMDAHQLGNFNTSLGWNAGGSFTNASGNVLLGASAGASIDGSNNTIIGRIEGVAGTSNTIILGAGATTKVTITGDNFTLTSADGDDATFVTSSLTADRTYTLPNQAGTIALTSDIPGGDDNLTLHNLSVVNDDNVQVARISGDAGGSAMFASGNLAINNAGQLQFNAAANAIRIGTAGDEFSLPTSAGTLALTSDINAGTVTSVATNSGLAGGPVTSAGTIGIAAGGVGTTQLANDAVNADKLNATDQAANRVLAMNGSNDAMVWVNQSTSAGTVTSVATNSGLAGGPVTSAGTIGIAAGGVDTTQLANDAVTFGKLNATSQAANLVLAMNSSNNGMVWVAKSNNAGTVTSVATNNGLTGGTITSAGTIGIANGGVGTTQLADDAVTVGKLNATSQAANLVLAVNSSNNGMVWVAKSNNAGTVTSVATNNGLTGGTITSAGTIGIANGGVGTTQLADDAVTFGKLNATSQAANRVLAMNGSNNAMVWVNQSAGGTTIPQGTVMLFFQASAPTGFTQVTTQNNKALRVVSGSGGGTGGSSSFTSVFGSSATLDLSGSVGDTTLSTAQIPSHQHSGLCGSNTPSSNQGSNASTGFLVLSTLMLRAVAARTLTH